MLFTGSCRWSWTSREGSSSIKRNRARWKTPNYHRRRANAVQYCRGRSSSTLMQSSTAMRSHKFARGKMGNGGHPKRFVRGARGNDNDNARAARTLADERGCALTSLDTRRRQPTRTLANGCREPDASKRKTSADLLTDCRGRPRTPIFAHRNRLTSTNLTESCGG